MMDTQIELIDIEHKPMRPPRKEHIGEAVFYEQWLILMEQDPAPYSDHTYKIECILYQMPVVINQRIATVAATFITWLGTNCGQCFLSQAATLAEGHTYREQYYVGAWTMENHRRRGINNGFRTIEFLLAPDTHFHVHEWPHFGGLATMPELSAGDYETLEHLAYWLGSHEGQIFLELCRAEMNKRHDAERRRKMREFEQRHAKPISATLEFAP